MGVMWLNKLHLLICTVSMPAGRIDPCQICSCIYTLYTVASSLGCFNQYCKQPPTTLGTGSHADKIISKALISQRSTQLLLKDSTADRVYDYKNGGIFLYSYWCRNEMLCGWTERDSQCDSLLTPPLKYTFNCHRQSQLVTMTRKSHR